MITVTIDGKQTEVAPETFILEAAKQVDVHIPALCDSEMVEPYGACRVCSVEIDDGGRRKIVTACNYPIRKPIEVFTASERAARTRKNVFEMMLARWPGVKIVRDMAKHAGVEEPRFTHPQRNETPNACILCGLCVRMCREGVWHNVLAFEGRGTSRRVVMPETERSNECNGCGACAVVCPTGAITMEHDPNNPVDPKRIRRAGMVLTRELILFDEEQARMRATGTGHLLEIMDDYDLMPVHNFKFGAHPEAKQIHSPSLEKNYWDNHIFDGCYHGCDMACAKVVPDHVVRTGPNKGQQVLVDGPEYETLGGSTNLGVFEPEWIFEINYYCDDYGIDTISFSTLTAFCMECFEAGVLDTDKTGGIELRFGNAEAALELLHQMGHGEGFGLIAGQGIRRMKKIFAEEYGADPAFLRDIGMENKGLEYSEYVTKESLAQQGGYGLTLKGAQHDEAWLIFMDMVNKQIPTFEDKAEALHFFPMLRTWFGLQGLCKLLWNDIEPEDNAEEDEPQKVPKHLQGYCELFAGMTGKEVTADDLLLQSERVYNFQRIFNLKMGFGTREHDVIPYRSQGPVTEEEYLSREQRYDRQIKEQLGLDPAAMSTAEKIAALREYKEDQYEKLIDAVYHRRGWTSNGIPTLATARRLGIDKVDGLVELLAEHGVTE